MRIVSLLPAATEIICALGLNEQLRGISHCCNFPTSIINKPRISYTDIDYDKISSIEIDKHVEKSMHARKSLYQLNKELLGQIKPTHILTQALCDVCAVTPSDVQKTIKDIYPKPEVIELNPRSLEQICVNVLSLGKKFKRDEIASRLVKTLKIKISKIKKKTHNLVPKTIFCIEWLDPLYACGHWVPEMIKIAGGIDPLSYPNDYSYKISWKKVVDLNPEIIILMACSFSIERTESELSILTNLPFWEKLNSVRNNNVWIVDGASYFNQSGIRTIDKGIKILAQIIHPEIFGEPKKNDAVNIKEL